MLLWDKHEFNDSSRCMFGNAFAGHSDQVAHAFKRLFCICHVCLHVCCLVVPASIAAADLDVLLNRFMPARVPDCVWSPRAASLCIGLCAGQSGVYVVCCTSCPVVLTRVRLNYSEQQGRQQFLKGHCAARSVERTFVLHSNAVACSRRNMTWCTVGCVLIYCWPSDV